MAFGTFSANFLGNRAHAGAFFWPDWLERKAWGIEELLERHKAELVGLRGKIDILAGGPPCQGFSFAGRRQEEDPRNMLFEKYVEVVEAIKPQLLVLENVPGMKVIHHRRNVVELVPPPVEPRRQSFFDRLVKALDEAGYAMEGELVDASCFGVPQRRVRLIAVGIRKDLLRWLPGGPRRAFELFDEAGTVQLQELGLPATVSSAEAISDLELSRSSLVACVDSESARGFEEASYQGPRTAYQSLMQTHAPATMDSMRLARHREDVSARFARIISECRQGVRMNDASRKTFGLKKHRIYPMAASEPAPTITTLPDDILHYAEPRILTVRECARLQSFPDWFRFTGKFTTGGDRRARECPRYTQVGNAVPPYLARALGMALKKMLVEIADGKAAFLGARAGQQVAAIA